MEHQPGTPSQVPSSAAAAAADFKRMPMAEKILAVAAAGGFVGFLVYDIGGVGGFDAFFELWMPTCLFIGSVVVLALIGTKLFGITLLAGGMYTKVLVGAAVLPAVGLVIDAFSNMGYFICLAAIVLMAYAGAKITTRENILKR